MIEPAYRYRATLDRVVDGDTYLLRVDVGFRAAVTLSIRVRGLNTPELHGPDRVRAAAASVEAGRLLRNASTIVVETYKDAQSFARWVGDVYIDGESIAERLIATGFGVKP